MKTDSNTIAQALGTLKKYKEGKTNLENRIISNEQWWKMRHWEQVTQTEYDVNRPRPASAWLFNSLANKHADAMDNYPEPSVLPREEGDKEAATQLSSVLPVILEQNNYEKLYSKSWWYKLKSGSMCQAVTWNSHKLGGIGDIEISKVELLNLFWEPGIDDIQNSRNVFYVSLVDNDILESTYPELKGKTGGDTVNLARYQYDDHIDTSEKSVVVDWYYKKSRNGKQILHFCKFCNDTILFCSENDERYAEKGFYEHGMYPFVIDTLFEVEGSPCGFGYIDIMRDAQMYIDKLGQMILEHTVQMSRKRFFIKHNGAVREEEFADFRKPFVHVAGNLSQDDIREIKIDPLDSAVMTAMNNKIEELKETSGNRDFSQGSTASGVTAASAIAALQEAGSKLSRDMLKTSYNSFTLVCNLVIELIRQFYDAPRYFRITGDGGKEEFVRFDNRMIKNRKQGNTFGVELGEHKPVFDVVCKASKKSPFSKMAQNELMKELYHLGFFNPQMTDQALLCLDGMDFDGKQMLMEKIQRNGTMYQQLQSMQVQIAQLTDVLNRLTGGKIPNMIPQGVSAPMPEGEDIGKSGIASAISDAVTNSTTDVARQRAQNVTAPR